MHNQTCVRSSSAAKTAKASPVVSASSYPDLVKSLSNTSTIAENAATIVSELETMQRKGFRLDRTFKDILNIARDALYRHNHRATA